MSEMSGVNYQSLIAFMSLRSRLGFENQEMLLNALENLEPVDSSKVFINTCGFNRELYYKPSEDELSHEFESFDENVHCNYDVIEQEEILEKNETKNILIKRVETLKKEIRKVMFLSFGIGVSKDYTIEEISITLKISKACACQRRRFGLKRLFRDEMLRKLRSGGVSRRVHCDDNHEWRSSGKRYVWSMKRVEEDGLVV